MSSTIPYDRISIAPMINVTNEYFLLTSIIRNSYHRFYARLLSKHTVLYTEMYVDEFLIHHKNVDPYLQYEYTILVFINE